MFGIKGPTFERLITLFIYLLSNKIYKIYVETGNDELSMENLIRQNETFLNFLFVRCGVDVTFLLAYCQTGCVTETNVYVSGYYKQHVYKVEVLVLPNGVDIYCARQYLCSKSDRDILKSRTRGSSSFDEKIVV